MRKIFKGLAAALVLVVVLTVLGVGVDGWRLYRNAVGANRHRAGRGAGARTGGLYAAGPAARAVPAGGGGGGRPALFTTTTGVDPIAIARAVWVNLRTGSLAEGGSTLTQQLAKNLYFTQEKKFTRKVAEVFTA